MVQRTGNCWCEHGLIAKEAFNGSRSQQKQISVQADFRRMSCEGSYADLSRQQAYETDFLVKSDPSTGDQKNASILAISTYSAPTT